MQDGVYSRSFFALVLVVAPVHALMALPGSFDSLPPGETGAFEETHLAAASVYYVDAVYGSDVWGDGSMGWPWRTITYALGQVVGPDVDIHVAPGLYDEALGESFPITMEPGVSLIGAGPPAATIKGGVPSRLTAA